MQRQYSAGIVVYRINEAGQRLYLLLHYVQGHWDLPKGHLEAGETEEQAALRELKEETGLTTEIISGFREQINYTLEFDGVKIFKTVTFFVGKVDSDQVRLSNEHVNYDWLSYEQALHKLTYNNARQILMNIEVFLSRL